MMSALRDTLSTFGLFSDLPPAALDKLALAMRRQQVDRGDILFHQGDDPQLAYMVVSGRLRLIQHTADGKDVTMASFTPGDGIGLVMLLTGEVYPGTAEVLEASELVTFSAAPLWELINGHAPFSVRIIQMLATHLYEAHNRIRELSAERVQQRERLEKSWAAMFYGEFFAGEVSRNLRCGTATRPHVRMCWSVWTR